MTIEIVDLPIKDGVNVYQRLLEATKQKTM
jgi:hypothetical protein